MQVAGRIVRTRAFAPLAALALLWLLILCLDPGYFALTVQDGRLFGGLVDILNRAAPVALLAIGMSLVIATGGIDLSVGAIMAIAGAVTANMIVAGDYSVPVIVLAGLGAGALAGLINGSLIARLGIQPIVATLILMVAGRGVAQLINGGQIITFQNEAFAAIGTGQVLGLPSPVWIVALVAAGIIAAVRRTALGLFIETVGSNETAGRFVGLPVGGLKLAVYVILDICAAMAGIVATADIQGADANNVGLWIELDAILAVVIGGASLTGGRFSVSLSVAGALIIQSINTAIVLSGIPADYNLVIKAVVIILVLLGQSPEVQRHVKRLAMGGRA